MKTWIILLAAASAVSTGANAQDTAAHTQPVTVAAQPVAIAAQPVNTNARILAAGTLLTVAPMQDITSKKAKEGTEYEFQVVNDVVEQGYVVIPRGSPVKGAMTWKTGRAIGGKSGKFDITFKSVNIGGKSVLLRGVHRQEGKGNTVGALLGSMFISGRSAVMTQGQIVNAFTAEPIQF